MKNSEQAGFISLSKSKRQCKLYHQLGKFAESLNELPDTQAVLKDKAKSAPLPHIPMVF